MIFFTVLRAALLAGAAGAVLVLELRRRARPYVERPSTHAARNLIVAGIAAATVHLIEAPVVVPLSRAVAKRKWGLTWRLGGPSWLRDTVAILLLDYTLYLWHILTHRVPLLWRFHLVHHVDLDLDATTGLRFHAGELAADEPSHSWWPPQRISPMKRSELFGRPHPTRTDESPLPVRCLLSVQPRRLKNWMARSCLLAASSVGNVPRFRRFPIFGSGFREYTRYSPDRSLRIMTCNLLVTSTHRLS